MRRPAGALLGLSIVLPACGGGGDSPARPSAPQAPVQTTITVVSGETDQAVAGASVTVAGRALTSDADGRVVLADRPATNALVDVIAGGFLDRQTVFRSGTTRLSLWPRQAANGLSEDFTAHVVYTSAGEDDPVVGETALVRLRPAVNLVTLVAAPEIQNDGAALRALEDAAGQVGAASQGEIVYTVAGTRPGSGTFFEARVDPGDRSCDDSTRGFFRGRYVGDEIVGGEVVFCTQAVARSATASHEVGHSLGLQHSNSPRDLMYGTFVRGRPTSLSPREGLALRLMLERRAGNRFPDNDRDASGSRAARTRVTICQ